MLEHYSLPLPHYKKAGFVEQGRDRCSLQAHQILGHVMAIRTLLVVSPGFENRWCVEREGDRVFSGARPMAIGTVLSPSPCL